MKKRERFDKINQDIKMKNIITALKNSKEY